MGLIKYFILILAGFTGASVFAETCSSIAQFQNSCNATCGSGGGSPDERQTYNTCLARCKTGADSASVHCTADVVPIPIPRPSDSPADSSATTSATPSPEDLAQQCIGQAQDKINACTTNQTSASSNCDMSNSSLTTALKQAAQVATQATGVSVQGACSNTATMVQSASTALKSFSGTCGDAKNSCTNSCADAKTEMDQCAKNSTDASAVIAAMDAMSSYQEVTANTKTCNGLQANINKADQATQSMASTDTSCSAATAAAMDPSLVPSSDPSSAYCMANPTVASCVSSCSRADLPAVYNSQTCVCTRNPRAPSCSGAVSAAAGNEGLTSQGGGVAASTTSSGASGADLNFDSLDKAAALKALSQIQLSGNATSDQNIGGRQGAGAMIGGDSGGLPSMSKGKGSAGSGNFADVKRAVSGGFYGGSSAASTSSGKSGVNNSKGIGLLPTTGQNASGNKLPDLRKFLPGGILDPNVNRHLSGAVIAGKDGMTGPTGSNWDKMQNRFRSLWPSLILSPTNP